MCPATGSAGPRSSWSWRGPGCMSGAAVQTDSLQLLLELNRARVSLLQDEARLRVARLLLGRRVGAAGRSGRGAAGSATRAPTCRSRCSRR